MSKFAAEPVHVTLEQFKTAIVRCAEREPDRVGLLHWLSDHDGNHCIIGRAMVDLTGKQQPRWSDLSNGHELYLSPLLGEVANLNNQGMKWRDIVIKLGLVPGEQPAEPVTMPETTAELAAV